MGVTASFPKLCLYQYECTIEGYNHVYPYKRLEVERSVVFKLRPYNMVLEPKKRNKWSGLLPL